MVLIPSVGCNSILPVISFDCCFVFHQSQFQVSLHFTNIYAFSQSRQGTSYTTFFFSNSGLGVFTCVSFSCSVWCDFNISLILIRLQTLCNLSDRPWQYRRDRILGLWGFSPLCWISELGLLWWTSQGSCYPESLASDVSQFFLLGFVITNPSIEPDLTLWWWWEV